jgi:hypothetical protein
MMKFAKKLARSHLHTSYFIVTIIITHVLTICNHFTPLYTLFLVFLQDFSNPSHSARNPRVTTGKNREPRTPWTFGNRCHSERAVIAVGVESIP